MVGATDIFKKPVGYAVLFYQWPYVKDVSLSHAVRRAFSDVMYRGRQPAYVLYLAVVPESVDVNVHPTKNEVRFMDPRPVHDFVYRAASRVVAESGPREESGRMLHGYPVGAPTVELKF
ncbi:MAG: hypothetical protein CM1200mP20_08080 [Pseudomonadota bacterium]|nr:MAG: hypothetical protein CM1200mP20_08080 [Pseudomonadota bacterium]